MIEWVGKVRDCSVFFFARVMPDPVGCRKKEGTPIA